MAEVCVVDGRSALPAACKVSLAFAWRLVPDDRSGAMIAWTRREPRPEFPASFGGGVGDLAWGANVAIAETDVDKEAIDWFIGGHLASAFKAFHGTPLRVEKA